MNPFRSEAAAYRFLLLTIGYFGAIAVASLLGGPWVGTPVFVVLTAAGLWWIVRRRTTEAPAKRVPASQAAEGERRILVIANETVGGERLRECIGSRAEGVREEVLVVCPALNTALRHWVSDDDPARAEARERLAASLRRLHAAGVAARGEVGDAEPLQALDDAVRSFGPDEIIISTHPEGRSRWLEKGLVERARERYDTPITHIVTDLASERG
jgi:nucleotide-binding universal stress UspA family protein